MIFQDKKTSTRRLLFLAACLLACLPTVSHTTYVTVKALSAASNIQEIILCLPCLLACLPAIIILFLPFLRACKMMPRIFFCLFSHSRVFGLCSGCSDWDCVV